MEFKGQTGQPLQVKAPSSIVSSEWLHQKVAAGTTTRLLVKTQFVSDGSEVKVSLKDADGKEVVKAVGKTVSDLANVPLSIPVTAKGGPARCDLEMSAHGLNAKAPPLEILAPIKVEEIKWLDEKGQAVQRVLDGASFSVEAKLQGAPEGAPAKIEVFILENHTRHQVFSKTLPVAEKKVKTPIVVTYGLERTLQKRAWAQLQRHGESYEIPQVEVQVSCLGSSLRAKLVPLHQVMVRRYIDGDGAGRFEGKTISILAPDGKKEQKSIPKDGVITIEQSLPGNYEIDESKVFPLD